ncbi:MAG: hypothetical protein IJU71_08255, partial [Selenomonadaceae bacterium]|nr:hypothetical protein [Selenomonadaceae bacterium]
VLRLTGECDDKNYGELIKQAVCKIILQTIDGGITLDVVFVSDLVSIARGLNVEDKVQFQLRERIIAIALMVAREQDKFQNSMAWVRSLVNGIIKYLIEVGRVTIQKN